MIIVHGPNSAIIHSQGATNQLFGYEAEQLKGRRLEDLGLLFYEAENQKLPDKKHPVWRILQEKKPISNIDLAISSSKTEPITWTQFSGYPKLDAQGNVEEIVTTYIAVTESKYGEKNQPEPRIDADWEGTFNALQDVITILSPDLVILKANKAAFTVFELEGCDIIGKHCFEVFHNKSEPCAHCPAWHPKREFVAGSEIIYNARVDKSFEVRSYPVLDDKGRLKQLVHSARDVTGTLKNEEVRTILSSAIEQASDSILIADVEGTIQYTNPACSKTTGYSKNELRGKSLNLLTAKEEDSFDFSAFSHELNGANTWQGRVTCRRKDGGLIEGNASIGTITDAEGKITNFVMVKRDITKEEELQKQLQQAMKMEAIGTLAGGIAHDFNNILAAMIGYGQIAKGKMEPDDPTGDAIDQILLAGDRAAQLVKQILTFSRRDNEGSFHHLKVQHIITEITKLIRSSFPTTIKFHLHIDKDCPAIMADSTQIHQLIMNLCTNARQAIGEAYGFISITLEKYNLNSPELLHGTSLLTKGRYVKLIISDNGPGMSKEMLARVFDPFFTTKPKTQGTGLGLSMVHGIVERHGGTIHVDSEIDRGTTFNIFLPVVDKNTVVSEGEKSAESLDLGNGEHVMVVDDEKPIGDMLGVMLAGLGYTVTKHSSSLEAVSDFRRRSQEFDAVITDMTMPDMTGAELAREMLSIRPELPIIMTTGYNETIDAGKASRIGIRSFVLKPVKKDKLAIILRTLLGHGKHSHN